MTPVSSECASFVGAGASVWWHDARHGQWAATAQLTGPPADAVAWAPVLGRPSELLAAASGADITVWSLRGPVDALEVGTRRCHGAVTPRLLHHAEMVQRRRRPTWSPAASEVEFAALWQAEKVAELRAAAPVQQLEFNGMGSWLAASIADGQVQLWRPALDGTWNLLMAVQGTPDEEVLQVDS